VKGGKCYAEAVGKYTNMTEKIEIVNGSLYSSYLKDVINLKN